MKTVFDILISDSILQKNGSYKSTNGRIIWSSIEQYQLVNRFNIKGSFAKKKIKK